MQIQISWLLQRPTDLDLHCYTVCKDRVYPGSAGQRLINLPNEIFETITWPQDLIRDQKRIFLLQHEEVGLMSYLYANSDGSDQAVHIRSFFFLLIFTTDRYKEVVLVIFVVMLWGRERANLSAFRTFVRFVFVWFCWFPVPLGVWEGLRFRIVAPPGLFSYPFFNSTDPS